jgi:molybdopterin synthase sulfur carrier subunit
MKVTVRYFASIREALGTGSEVVDTSSSTLSSLRDELIARGGAHAEALARGRSVRLALDQVMVADESAELRDGSEVAFFPPVTGG